MAIKTGIKTGIVMLNLGGPATLDDVQPFLLELFADREIIQLPAQSWLGPFIARRRTPKVQANYRAIGGGSPIRHWTSVQGEGMVRWLDQLSPATAPHQYYIAFRYTAPFSSDALKQMQADGVEHAIVFTQYPQFSCSTTGSSLNELWRAHKRQGSSSPMRWSIIDRWPTHVGFIAAVISSIQAGLATFEAADREKVLLLFSAHSLPLDVIDRGDPYPQEIAASVQAVMEGLGFSHEFLLAYQSAVGPLRWLGPQTETVIRQLGARGQRHVLVIPIAFTSDHIETLSEIDIEYAELAHQSGITQFRRVPALNDSPAFQRTLADIVIEHIQSGKACSSQYRLRCPGCTNSQCRQIVGGIS